MIRIFKHFVPRPLFLLAMAEALILFLSIYAGVELRFLGGETEHAIVGPLFPRAVAFTLVMSGIMTALGLFTRESQSGDLGYYMRFLASFVLGGVSMLVVFYALPDLYLGRGVMALAFGVAFVGTALTRIVFLRIVDLDTLKRRLLVLGAGTRAAQIGALLANDVSIRQKFHLIGYWSPGDISQQRPHVPREQILAEHGALLAIATRHRVDEIVVAIRERRNSGIDMKELLECKLEGIQVTDISTFFERETGRVQLDSLNESWLVFSDGFCRTSMRSLAKRVFDVIASLALLVVTLPVMVLTALLIVLESGFPLFYRQERIGECGGVFRVVKFRSMRTDAEKGGTPQWARQNDNRVTRVGRVIRQLRIDELPQLINVLRGDMSFVGPRPERPYFVTQLADQIPFFRNRHSVKPGITGWAQIRYPYGSSVEDSLEKLQYDLYYVKNHSLFLDLIILFQTAQVVLFGKGAR